MSEIDDIGYALAKTIPDLTTTDFDSMPLSAEDVAAVRLLLRTRLLARAEKIKREVG